MKYTLKIENELPLSKVIRLFENPANWSRWREGLISFEALKGTPGEEGSETRLINMVGGKETVMTETVEVKIFPRK